MSRRPGLFAVIVAASALFQPDATKAQTPTTETELLDWDLARRLGNAESYLVYLLRHPRGTFVGEAVAFLRAAGVLGQAEDIVAAARASALSPPPPAAKKASPKTAKPGASAAKPADTPRVKPSLY